MMVKLQVATRKLLTPTSTGIFFLRRKGAKTGSGAMNSSTRMNAIKKTKERAKGRYTYTCDHYSFSVSSKKSQSRTIDARDILLRTECLGR